MFFVLYQTQVAVKCLTKDKVQTQTADFLQEATIMHSIDHAHIVQLYGVVLGADNFMLVRKQYTGYSNYITNHPHRFRFTS